MQIVQESATIMIRFERGNTTRLVHMDGAPPSADQVHTGLGHSVGRWDGDTLSIETTHMTVGVIFNNRGYPISPAARITERYSREPGGNDLRMELLVEDPMNYTQTFTLRREWVWAPDEQIREWVCIDLGPRDSEPDLDELTRILEQL